MLNNTLKKSQLYIYQKILLLLFILLIPLYLINTLINILGSNYIKKEISKSVISNVQFYSQHIDNELSYINLQRMQFINNSDLQSLCYLYETLDNFDKSMLINRVKEYMSTIRDSSDYIKNVCVYVKSINCTISTEKGITFLPNPEYDTAIKLLLIKTKNNIKYFDNRLFLISTLPVSAMHAVNKANIIVYIEISKEKIEQVLSQLAVFENSGAFMTSHDFALTISSSKDKNIIGSIINTYRSLDFSDSVRLFKSGDRRKVWIAFDILKIQDFIIFSYMPEHMITGGLKTYNILYSALLILEIVIILIFSYSANIMIHKPLKQLVDAFKLLEANKLDISLQHQSNDEFGYLYSGFNSMVERLKLFINQNFEQKIALQEAELKLLQSQINPHFLYNSFFTINRMCKISEYDKVVNFTQNLGNYYQFITRSGADEVPLIKEFMHAMNYIDIQRIRFLNRITIISDNLPEECKNILVPRIIIQPIIENAFKHVFEKSISHGIIRIRIKFKEGILCISIEDNGSEINSAMLKELQNKLSYPSDSNEKTGIVNVNRRIKLTFGEESGIFFSKSEYGGLLVKLIIFVKRNIENV